MSKLDYKDVVKMLLNNKDLNKNRISYKEKFTISMNSPTIGYKEYDIDIINEDVYITVIDYSDDLPAKQVVEKKLFSIKGKSTKEVYEGIIKAIKAADNFEFL